MMARVLLPLAKGFEEVEAVSLIDVMRRGGIEVVVAYLDSSSVLGANGITIQADTPIDDLTADKFDMIVLPGGWDGTYALADSDKVQSLLKDFKNRDKVIGAICAAPFALNRAGVLGDEYTCYPSVEESIKLDGYRKDKMVVTDGNILTSRGPGTALCFGLEIVKRLVGVDTYEALKEGMLLDFCK
jgi:4-methyl-5(b-hydroxyethyl)-thiazole monophosphate biosynthesis